MYRYEEQNCIVFEADWCIGASLREGVLKKGFFIFTPIATKLSEVVQNNRNNICADFYDDRYI